jgi:hypothetical protein
MLLVDQTDFRYLSTAQRQAKVDAIQDTPYHAFANLPSWWTPANWMLDLVSEKPLIPWQFLSPAFDLSQQPYRFDYDGSLNKLDDFMADLRNTLQVAKQMGSPGIVLDLEFYTNTIYSGIGDAATFAGISQVAMKAAFVVLGEQIATVINDEFPDAVIWGPLCVVGSTGVLPASGWSANWITQGILATLLPTVTLIAGAEAEIPYQHVNYAAFESDCDKFRAGAANNEDLPDNVVLGCPLELWNDKDETGSFVETWLAAHPECMFNVLEDFRPVVAKAKRNFSYVWIYNYPAATGWSPFDSSGDAVAQFLGQPS